MDWRKHPCIEWPGRLQTGGYGQVKRGGRHVLVHRLEWALANGPIPTGLCVLHRCDNPRCYNLAHLFLGTQGDNVRDCIAKGRRRPIPSPEPQCDRCHSPYEWFDLILVSGSFVCERCFTKQKG